MTANNVIDAVRRRLGDSFNERWSDEQLLLYVSLCQNDICVFTGFHRVESSIPMVAGQTLYDLPSDCIALTRAEAKGEILPIQTTNDIDNHTVITPCIIKDLLPYNKLEVYNDGSDVDFDSITIFYKGVPPLLISMTEELLLPDYWLVAFIHYVTGAALQDDNDANNIQRGEMELQKYGRMLDKLYKASAKDFTSNMKNKLDTNYRRVI